MNLELQQLTFRIATGLAERYPAEQFLPEEINDALISVINHVGEAALRAAIRNSWAKLEAGVPVDELGWTRELTTLDRFATTDTPRDEIVLCIQDLSGLERDFADFVLRVLEVAVDEPIFGVRNVPSEDVRFEGIGVIRAGKAERSYYILLDESLCVPPLKNISSLSRYQAADERKAPQGDSSSASASSQAMS